MSGRTTNLKLLLLDANVIIKAHKLGIWQLLIERAEIVVPSIIARDEALYYSLEEGQIPTSINVPLLIDAGKIKEFSASLEELDELQSKFDREFVEHIHPGEREALALLFAGRLPDYYFCSGDAKAIQTAAMLRLGEQIVSLEKTLKSLGLEKKLEFWFSEDFCKKQLDIGHQNLIQGRGIAK